MVTTSVTVRSTPFMTKIHRTGRKLMIFHFKYHSVRFIVKNEKGFLYGPVLSLEFHLLYQCFIFITFIPLKNAITIRSYYSLYHKLSFTCMRVTT